MYFVMKIKFLVRKKSYQRHAASWLLNLLCQGEVKNIKVMRSLIELPLTLHKESDGIKRKCVTSCTNLLSLKNFRLCCFIYYSKASIWKACFLKMYQNFTSFSIISLMLILRLKNTLIMRLCDLLSLLITPLKDFMRTFFFFHKKHFNVNLTWKKLIFFF